MKQYLAAVMVRQLVRFHSLKAKINNKVVTERLARMNSRIKGKAEKKE